MMSIFWVLAGLMLLLAATFVVMPWIRFQRTNTDKGLTSDWYQNRLGELQKELASGQFSKQEYDEALAELKLTARAELVWQKGRKVVVATDEQNLRPYLYSALGLLAIVTSAFYWQAGHHQQIADWQKTLMQMPELSQKIIQDSDQPVTAEELQNFALGLRSKLAEQEEAIGWMLLGRTLMALNDIEGAITAFEKSYEMKPGNVSNTVSLAQALQRLTSQGRGETFELDRSVRLLSEVLNRQPDNEFALLLFSEGNLLLERFEVARQGLLAARATLPQDDPRQEAIAQRLDYVAQQLGENLQTSHKLAILVEIGSELAGRTQEFSHVFVFAKVEGVPMPIAVKKVPVTEFPLSVSLSDADIMLPELTLSSQTKVSLVARLSVDELAPFAKGDWQGQVLNIDTKRQEVIKMRIDEEFK